MPNNDTEFLTRTDAYDYFLPDELVAQTPAYPRDTSRMLVYNRATGKHEIRIFRDIIEYLRAGDVLVLNDTKVMRARLYGKKVGSTTRIEILLTKLLDDNTYEVLLKPAKRLRLGDKVEIESIVGELISKNTENGTAIMRFSGDPQPFGEMPLPHYIKPTGSGNGYHAQYQTVYADDNKTGSCAAPTAGLHWTTELLERAREKGVQVVNVTLHVGLGTFRPVKTDNILEHKMHSEFYTVTPDTIRAIVSAKRENRRVICVGTTSVRTLESIGDEIIKHVQDPHKVTALSGASSIFIYPPYKFKIVDAMITNFHLPKSTLIMLVSAFLGNKKGVVDGDGGRETAQKLYKFAVDNKFRFYSFGDACFLE